MALLCPVSGSDVHEKRASPSKSRSTSSVPSVDPPSTTISSTFASSWPSTLSIAPRMYAP